jgi:hypothetical protein
MPDDLCAVCGESVYVEDQTAYRTLEGRVWFAHPTCARRLDDAAPEMAALLAEWDTFPMNTVSVEDLRDRRKALLARIRGEA